jgi:uncharacterized membrane protein YfcA
VGLAKTAIGGLGTIAVALFAAVMPARESTAGLLLLLLVGDALAIRHYGRHGDWSLLRRLVPAVLPGLVAGTLVLAVVDDLTLRRGIAVILILLVVLQLLAPGGPAPEGGTRWSWPAMAATGTAAGFTTMVANAGGAVMTLYLVAQGVEKRRFIGTAAWFFLGVNLSKLPFSVGLGLVDTSMLWTTLVLAPAVGLGAWAGVHLIRRIDQVSFERTVLVATAVSAVALLLG